MSRVTWSSTTSESSAKPTSRQTRRSGQAIIRNFISGQYGNALRVVAFNTAEGWPRDVSEDIANEVLERAFDADDNLSEDTKRFIDRQPRARNGPRHPRCGAEKIRPSARKPELRIDFGRPWPDSGGHGNSHAWTRHQGRCQRSARRWSPASPGSMCSVPAAAPARRSICGRSIATRWPLSAPLCSACGARGARALRRCPKLTGLFAPPPAQRGPVRSARLARGRGSGVV
jgi:hypothetical protein